MELNPVVVRRFVASSPRGFGDLLARELQALGAADVRERAVGVEFSGSLEVAYRACLWSRLASRVLLTLATLPAGSSAQLHARLRELPWEEHLDPDGTLGIIGVTVSRSNPQNVYAIFLIFLLANLLILGQS